MSYALIKILYEINIYKSCPYATLHIIKNLFKQMKTFGSHYLQMHGHYHMALMKKRRETQLTRKFNNHRSHRPRHGEVETQNTDTHMTANIQLK